MAEIIRRTLRGQIVNREIDGKVDESPIFINEGDGVAPKSYQIRQIDLTVAGIGTINHQQEKLVKGCEIYQGDQKIPHLDQWNAGLNHYSIDFEPFTPLNDVFTVNLFF